MSVPSPAIASGYPLVVARGGAIGMGDEAAAGGFFEQNPVICARRLIDCHLLWHGCQGASSKPKPTELRWRFGNPSSPALSRKF